MKTITKIKYKIANQTGASAVEFAIVLPLLVVFLFGIIEFSILFFDKAVITNASREGARYGIVYSPAPRVPIFKTGDRDGIRTKAIDYSTEHLITFGIANIPDVEVDLSKPDGQFFEDTPCEAADDTLIVTVTYHYDFLLVPDLLTAFFANGEERPSGYDIQAVTKMRCE